MKLLLLFLIVCSVSASDKINLEVFQNDLVAFWKNHKVPQRHYEFPKVFQSNMEKNFDNDVVCTLCHLVVDLVIDEIRYGMPKEDLMQVIEDICIWLKIESPRVCHGAIRLHSKPIFYIIDNFPNLKAERFCGSVLQNYHCPTGSNFNWSIKIPPKKNTLGIEKTVNDPLSFNILQISDIHYDPNYKINGNADCGEPICCQTDQGPAVSQESSCGFWSDYRFADSPWHLIEEVIRHTKTQNFDYVYYTGDIVSHRVWETSIQNNTDTITKLNYFLKDSYEVPIFPVFGNHEAHPINVWPDINNDLSIQWLLRLGAHQWSEMIGINVSDTVLKGGYYTVSPKKGFRIIGINSNLCYTDNWWLVYHDIDPFDQLQWLVDVLQQAETIGERVHILSHVPSGDSSCLKVWSREYHRIVERFSNTIMGQFNGHTHRDEFHVYYSNTNIKQAIGVAFNGASVTPYDSSNPSYKVYKVDSNNFTLLDYNEWTFNLTLANFQASNEPPQWYKLYSFVEAYGVNNLQASEVDDLLYKMAKNHSLLDDYFRFKFRNGDAGIINGCDSDCREEILCDVATSQFDDLTQCDYFITLYKKTNVDDTL